VAVMAALLLMVFMGLAAFAVDVGQWYLVGQQEQRAADAAAMAGVTSLPGNLAGANALASTYSKANGFEHLPAAPKNPTTVTSVLDGKNTRLRVTVSRTVSNIFGPLLGVPNTTISRTAVADYTGPVPLASPCNEFGNDPDPGSPTNKSTNCANVGSFWANVGSPKATKVSGDAHQSNVCTTAQDGCAGSVNSDYDANGYIYVVTVTAPVTGLTIQAFDPSQIIVGDTCSGGGTSQLEEAAGIGSGAPLGSADASVRYRTGAGAWCSGDTIINGTSGLIKTQFTVRATGGNAWDPTSWPVQTGCNTVSNPRTFNGFNTRLRDALDSNRNPIPEVRETFRRWVTLCTITGTVQPGTYAIQVKTNGLTPLANPSDLLGGHNRFALRAFGSGSTDEDFVTVAAFNKMAVYANTPNGTSRFFLAKVPSGAKGQTFNIRLFDVGDGATAGSSTIKVLPPSENGVGATFTGCTGTGVVNAPLPSCQIAVSSAYNGKWQKIAVPIPSTYTCDDTLLTGCWTRLEFFYGNGSSPADTTSWAASIDGDPVRLVE
jgi:Flp pilus assembly protein TadG